MGTCLSGHSLAENTKDNWICQPSPSGNKWICESASGISGSDDLKTRQSDTDASNTEPANTEPANTEPANTKIIPVTKNEEPIPYQESIALPETNKQETIIKERPAGLCETGLQQSLLSKLAEFTPPPPGETTISADQSDGDLNYFVLTGNVDIIREDQRLMAEKVIYDKNNNRVDAFDNVHFIVPDMRISASTGNKQIEGEQASFKNATYEMQNRNARGTASNIHREDINITRMTDLTYSTCPDERQDWVLKASKLKLDSKEGIGVARNASIRFKNIPIFYTPYIRFPIDNRRKSGFLMPSFGTSDESGTAIQVPYYWNIAPNRDAIISPRNLTKRGVLLGGEYRYLHKESSGRLDFEYLPDDELYKDDRHLVSYKHNKRYGQHWNTDVQLSHVSDDEYFINLGDNLSQTSTTHLERHANVNYTRENWSVFTRFQSFQPVGSSESYRRLPQILLTTNLPEKDNSFNYHLNAEYVNFDHKNDVAIGSRLDISPGVSFDLNDTAYFIKPKLTLRHTRYSLDQPVVGSPETPSRTTPIFSLDSGIFLERESSIGNWGYLQTLEPRVYYLYVPYKDQSLFPVFDTGSLSDSMAQLFRENRFSGADRQGDANQISTSITTRFIDNDSGQERLSASIGQIYYLDDRKVNLSGNAVTSFNQSDLFAEIRAVPWNRATLSANVQWDTHQNEVSQSSVQLQYKRDNQHILNLAYRFQTQTQEQATLSSIWPISNRWSTVAHWDYSFKDEGNTLEGIGGIQYDTCCWSARLVYRNYLLGDRDNNTIFLQLALKGLSRIGGEQLSGLLEEKIPGYQDIEDVQ